MNTIQRILKIVFWRNDGAGQSYRWQDSDGETIAWTQNHYLVEETVKSLIANDDVCEVRVVNGFDKLIFCWDYESGTILTSELLAVA